MFSECYVNTVGVTRQTGGFQPLAISLHFNHEFRAVFSIAHSETSPNIFLDDGF
jgi:hypothetical protein